MPFRKPCDSVARYQFSLGCGEQNSQSTQLYSGAADVRQTSEIFFCQLSDGLWKIKVSAFNSFVEFRVSV